MTRLYIMCITAVAFLMFASAGHSGERNTRVYQVTTIDKSSDFFSEVITEQLANGTKIETVVTLQAGTYRNGSYHFRSPYEQKKIYVFKQYRDGPASSVASKQNEKRNRNDKKPTAYAQSNISAGEQYPQCRYLTNMVFQDERRSRVKNGAC